MTDVTFEKKQKTAPYILTLECQHHRLICFLNDSAGASLTLNTSMLRGKYSQLAVFTAIHEQVGELVWVINPHLLLAYFINSAIHHSIINLSCS